MSFHACCLYETTDDSGFLLHMDTQDKEMVCLNNHGFSCEHSYWIYLKTSVRTFRKKRVYTLSARPHVSLKQLWPWKLCCRCSKKMVCPQSVSEDALINRLWFGILFHTHHKYSLSYLSGFSCAWSNHFLIWFFEYNQDKCKHSFWHHCVWAYGISVQNWFCIWNHTHHKQLVYHHCGGTNDTWDLEYV